MYMIPLLLLWFLLSKYTMPTISFVITTFSFSVNYVLHMLCSLIAMIFIHPANISDETLRYSLLALVTTFLQLVVITKLLKNKRLQKGLPASVTSYIPPTTTCIALFLLIFITYIPSGRYDFFTQATALIILCFTLAFLIYWWQAQIKKAYLRKLEIQELESTRIEMAELKLQLKSALEDNEKLARISHRDNTLIASLKNTAEQMLSVLEPESAEAIEAGKLLRNLELLSEERVTIIKKPANRTFDTGFPLIDSVLNEMDTRAIQDKIDFYVHFGIGLEACIPKNALEIDLMHIVDDLLKNAFKSTLTRETRVVQLQFYKSDKHFVIEVADSGIPFEIESLVNMGLERRTTYADGSGIGLVDIWEAKEKYRATYHLEEYRNPNPFTKRISISFDKKNRYSIRSYRKSDILQQKMRADLQIYNDYE